jgi:endonuclease YncB( thermonuclease family)
VRDGRTIRPSDGRELRLAGREVTDDCRAALKALANGHPVRHERLGPEHDRYGRRVPFAFAGDGQESVQQGTRKHGHPRVAMYVSDKACADALLSAKRAARTAHRGLWTDPNFAPLSAENRSWLEAERGRFALAGKARPCRYARAGPLYM